MELHSLHYFDTLGQFFALSNEAEEFSSMFGHDVLPVLEFYLPYRKLIWLDIGSGDGEKVSTMLTGFGSTRRIYLTIAEPDVYWHNFLKDQINRAQYPFINLTISNSDLEAALDTASNHYNLIGMHQLLFEQSLAQIVIDSIKTQQTLQSGTIFYITLESSYNNIFYQIRKKLKDSVVPEIMFSQIDFLKNELTALSSKFFSFVTTSKYLRNPFLEPESDWIFPFILGISQKEYDALPAEKRGAIEDVVKAHMLRDGLEYLPINEEHLVVVCK